MHRKYLEADSRFHKKKRRKFGRINELPEGIIILILSFLPLRESARTSVLSSKWRYLWKYTHNLNLDTLALYPDLQTRMDNSWVGRRNKPWDPQNCKYIKLVDSLLQSHKSPLKELIFSFYINNAATSKVKNWVEFAFSRGVESLELDLHCARIHHQLKEFVVLKRLLRHPILSSNSLKRLCLKSLKVGGGGMRLLLRNCPSLEELTIFSAVLTSRVEVCGGDDLMLKRLVIYYCTNSREFVKVSAPNLTWLKIDYEGGRLLFENVPRLFEAEFIIEKRQKFRVKQPSPSCCISSLQILHLTLGGAKAFDANGLPQMPNLKKLDVQFSRLVHYGLEPVTALIEAFPLLQECKIGFPKILPYRAKSMKVVTANVVGSEHRHLKVIEFGESIRDVNDHIEILRYILHNCAALEKIIIGRLRPPSSPNSRRVPGLIAEVQATRDYLNQQLQGKLAPHIQLLLV